jgi:hypothetical protein
MRKPPRRPRRPQQLTKWQNPKYEPGYRRRGRMPITLIDGSSRANIARDLAALAASIHAVRPCTALTLQRMAAQIRDSYTAAQAVANYTSKPSANRVLTEATLTEVVFGEVVLAELPTQEAPA